MRLLLVFLSFIAIQHLFAQQPDSTQVSGDTTLSDSIKTQQKKSKFTGGRGEVLVLPDSSVVTRKREGFFYRYFAKKYPNPRVAALLSFVLPGAGQVYNKKWWKVPIVYGALGGMTWLSVTNDKQYRALRNNYKWVVDGDDNTNPTESPYIFMSATQLKSYRDQFRGYTEKSYLFLGVTYLLVVTDAFVDAHLSSFDVSDDLTLKIVPDIQSGSGAFGASFGVGIRLGFGNSISRSAPTGFGAIMSPSN